MGLGDFLLWIFRAARRADRRRAAQCRRNRRQALAASARQGAQYQRNLREAEAARLKALREERIRQAHAEKAVRPRHRDEMILERRAGLKVDPKKHMRTSAEIAAEAKALLAGSMGRPASSVRVTVSDILRFDPQGQPASPHEAELTPGRVPRTTHQVHQLLAQLPPRWPYLYFAALLVRGKEAFEADWLDHKKRAGWNTGPQLSGSESLAIAQTTAAEIGACISSCVQVCNDSAVAEAFGSSAGAADPLPIEQLAVSTIVAYKDLLDIAARARQVRTHEEIRRLVDLTAAMADLPLQQLRQWIDRVFEQIDHIPDLVARAGGEKVVIDLTLTLSPDIRLADEFKQETDLLMQRLPLLGD